MASQSTGYYPRGHYYDQVVPPPHHPYSTPAPQMPSYYPPQHSYQPQPRPRAFAGVLRDPGNPNAQAWNSYYAQGGKDPAGLVYFIPETVQHLQPPAAQPSPYAHTNAYQPPAQYHQHSHSLPTSSSYPYPVNPTIPPHQPSMTPHPHTPIPQQSFSQAPHHDPRPRANSFNQQQPPLHHHQQPPIIPPSASGFSTISSNSSISSYSQQMEVAPRHLSHSPQPPRPAASPSPQPQVQASLPRSETTNSIQSISSSSSTGSNGSGGRPLPQPRGLPSIVPTSKFPASPPAPSFSVANPPTSSFPNGKLPAAALTLAKAPPKATPTSSFPSGSRLNIAAVEAFKAVQKNNGTGPTLPSPTKRALPAPVEQKVETREPPSPVDTTPTPTHSTPPAHQRRLPQPGARVPGGRALPTPSGPLPASPGANSEHVDPMSSVQQTTFPRPASPSVDQIFADEPIEPVPETPLSPSRPSIEERAHALRIEARKRLEAKLKAFEQTSSKPIPPRAPTPPDVPVENEVMEEEALETPIDSEPESVIDEIEDVLPVQEEEDIFTFADEEDEPFSTPPTEPEPLMDEESLALSSSSLSIVEEEEDQENTQVEAVDQMDQEDYEDTLTELKIEPEVKPEIEPEIEEVAEIVEEVVEEAPPEVMSELGVVPEVVANAGPITRSPSAFGHRTPSAFGHRPSASLSSTSRNEFGSLAPASKTASVGARPASAAASLSNRANPISRPKSVLSRPGSTPNIPTTSRTPVSDMVASWSTPSNSAAKSDPPRPPSTAQTKNTRQATPPRLPQTPSASTTPTPTTASPPSQTQTSSFPRALPPRAHASSSSTTPKPSEEPQPPQPRSTSFPRALPQRSQAASPPSTSSPTGTPPLPQTPRALPPSRSQPPSIPSITTPVATQLPSQPPSSSFPRALPPSRSQPPTIPPVSTPTATPQPAQTSSNSFPRVLPPRAASKSPTHAQTQVSTPAPTPTPSYTTPSSKSPPHAQAQVSTPAPTPTPTYTAPTPKPPQQSPKQKEPQSMALRLALEEERQQTQRDLSLRGRSPSRPPAINLDDMPPESLRKTPTPRAAAPSSHAPYPERGRSVPPVMQPAVPVINLPDGDGDDDEVDEDDDVYGAIVPRIAVSAPPPPSISVTVSNSSSISEPPRMANSPASGSNGAGRRPLPQPFKGNTPSNGTGKGPHPMSNGFNTVVHPKGTSLKCAGCNGLIVGRIVSAIGKRWHPACFKCTQCSELLEHVSSYEHDGKPYCHLDYHELFAPQCYHCKTSIVDERFITVTDPALSGGDTRYYHELHFFCAECGDPFLHPSASSAAPKGQRPRLHEDSANDVGYTVFRGHPYCEACHVRLRMPKCAGCKGSMRDEIVEALDQKWHFECFVCCTCKRPFEDPSFFQRGDQAFCDDCYRILLRSEI